MAKIIFEDKDGKKFEIWLRAAYSKIKTQKRLKEILDKSIASQSPQIADALNKKSYMDTMRYFGILNKTIFLGKEN